MKQWSDRGISGAKFLAIGMLLILCTTSATAMVKGNPLLSAAVSLIFGVLGPIFLVIGLYRIGTRHKQLKKPSKEVE